MPGIWDWMISPTTERPSIFGRQVADAATAPRMGSSTFDPNSMMGRYEQLGNEINAGARGMIGGMAEGVGNLLSESSSPVGIMSSIMPWMRGVPMMRNAAASASPILRHGRPTLDIVEDMPVRQVMPSADDVDAIIGNMRANLARIPSRGNMAANPRPLGPNMPAEMVPRGGESAYNAGRSGSIFQPRPANEVAYDAVRRRTMR